MDRCGELELAQCSRGDPPLVVPGPAPGIDARIHRPGEVFFEEAIQHPIGAEQLSEILEGGLRGARGVERVSVPGGPTAEGRYLYLPELIELDLHPPRYHVPAVSGQGGKPVTQGARKGLGGSLDRVGFFAFLLLEGFEQLGSLAHPVRIVVRIDIEGVELIQDGLQLRDLVPLGVDQDVNLREGVTYAMFRGSLGPGHYRFGPIPQPADPAHPALHIVYRVLDTAGLFFLFLLVARQIGLLRDGPEQQEQGGVAFVGQQAQDGHGLSRVRPPASARSSNRA